MTFTVCDASACGEDFLRAREIEEVSANLGMKPSSAPPEGSTPVQVSSNEAIHVAVGETRFIRLPCSVTKFALRQGTATWMKWSGWANSGKIFSTASRLG